MYLHKFQFSLFKLQNLFVRISKYISQSFKMCLFKLQSFSIFTQQRTLSDLLVGVEILLFEYFRKHQ